jgi:hypothetical protein
MKSNHWPSQTIMIDLTKFEAELKHKLDNMTDADLEELLSTKEIDYNHCECCTQNNKESCGKCMFCGEDGHTRSILFFTGSYCAKCYKLKNEETDQYTCQTPIL